MSASPALPDPRAVESVVSKPALSPSDNRVAVGFTALFMFCVLAFGGRERWPLFIFEAGSAVLFAAWVLNQVRSGAANLRWNPLFTPMAAFCGLLLVQLLPGVSAYWHATYAQTMLFVAYGMNCFLLAQTLTHNRQVRKLGTGLTIFGAVVAFFGVVQNLSSPNTLYWLQASRFGGRVYGPYVNSNHYAGLMEMLVPIPLVFAFSRFAHRSERWMAAFAAAFMGATIFLSGSRGGMIAFVVEIAVFAFFVFRENKRWNVAILISAFLLVLLGVVAWTGGPEVKNRIATLSSEQALSAEMRLKIDRDVIRMVGERPLLGWGQGTFAEVYPRFRTFYSDSLVNAAHNDYLQALAETGAIGFVIVIWFLALSIRSGLRKAGKWSSNVNGAVSLAAILGITGILVHSFVDFNVQVPANAVLFYSLCTLAAMDPRFSTHHRKHRKLTIEIPSETAASLTA